MTKKNGYLSLRRVGVFVVCAALGASASVDVMASSRAAPANLSASYNAATAHQFTMTAFANHDEFTLPTAKEREAVDPFLALAEHGVDPEPIRVAASELDLDLMGVRIAVAEGVTDKSVIPSADRKCMSQAIYYEARNQSSAGQMAVADVILNRVKSQYYPDDVCGVVYQGSQRETGCQFSFTCDGSMNKPVDVLAMKDAQRLSQAVLSGLRVELTRGALNYHAKHVAPYWAPALHKTAEVDDHIFYTPVRYASLTLTSSSEQ